MTFLPTAAKLTENRWLQHLIGTFAYRGLQRTGGLLRQFGWELVFHDEATNAPRQCPSCHAEIRLPRNARGFPDLIALRGDTLLVVELKSDRGTTTPEQRAWLAAFKGVRRVVVAVWRPKDLEQRVMRTIR